MRSNMENAYEHFRERSIHMGWRSGKLSSWAVGTWILSICIAHQPFLPPPGSNTACWLPSPNELSGIDRSLNWYTFWKKCFLNVAMMFSGYHFKNSPKYYCWTWIQTWTASASASAPLKPNQTLPRLTHLFQVSVTITQPPTGFLKQECKESPCAPSDEAEDFKRSSRSETSSLKQKGFSREMLGSPVENVGIRHHKPGPVTLCLGKGAGLKTWTVWWELAVGLWPASFRCCAAHWIVSRPQQVYAECRPRM